MHRHMIPQCFFLIIVLDANIYCCETAALGLKAWELPLLQLSPPWERQGLLAASKVGKQQGWDPTTLRGVMVQFSGEGSCLPCRGQILLFR